MKATIKLYKSDGSTEQGYPIKLVLAHKGKTRRRTIQYAHEFEWDNAANFPRGGHPDYDSLWDKVSNVIKVSRTETFREIESFDEAFDLLLKKSKPISTDFYKYGYDRVEALRQMGKNGNATVYNTALDALKKYHPYLNFRDLTPDLFKDFRDELKKEGMENSSIHNYLRTLRAIYNSAPRQLKNNDYPFENVFKELPVKKKRARNRYLSREQISLLERTSLPQKALQRAIDLSLLQFYLCGVDMIDIYYMRSKDISNGRVFLCRKKLGDRGEEFDVLLPDKAKKIIDKYAEPQDDGHLFPWRKSETAYKTWRKNHNRSLKTVKERLEIELLPRDDKWTTKVMRHTFATLGKFAHIEEDLLRELMGHERNEIDNVYKAKYPEKERDAAQLEVIGEN